MIWWLTIGGFLLGCVVAYAMVQTDGSNSDSDEEK